MEAEKKETGDKEIKETVTVPRSATELQRLKLEKLMKNPV